MSESGDQSEALRLIHEGRKKMEWERENSKISKLCGVEDKGTFDPRDTTRFWAVSMENQIPFPNVSAIDLANLAATLLPRCNGMESACETAAKLIRIAGLQIEREKSRDERSLGCLNDNEANRRMWENLGKRIEGFYETGVKKGNKRQKGKPFRFAHPDIAEYLAPFPISMSELFELAGLKDDTGRKRIDDYVEESIREAHRKSCEFAEQTGKQVPGILSKEQVKKARDNWKASFREQGIFQPQFLGLAERWPELRKVMVECRGEK